MGFELGWEFVTLVKVASITFTGFVNYITSQYRRNCPTSRPFMDHKTFIKWWFGWASSMHIDFRDPCKWCGWDPPILAGDGTHVGFPKSRADVDPIEARQEIPPLQTPHRRLERCFLSVADHRAHLKYLSSKFLQRGVCQMPPSDEEAKTAALMNAFPANCQAALSILIQQQADNSQLISLAHVFKLLSYDSSLSSLLPSVAAPLLQSYLEGEIGKDDALRLLGQYSPELAQLIDSFSVPQLPMAINSLLRHILHRVHLIFTQAIAPEQINPIAGSYDPPRLGRFYYFRPDGQQVRIARPFTMDKKSGRNDEFDDHPVEGACTKKYVKVPPRGSTFLFVWLCPSHGHCYGAHVVHGGEGRKDPAFSLYTHKQTAPSVLFYDFGCSLDEYNLNRESGYFQNTRVYHDLFHSYNHVCSSVYKSVRLPNLRYCNTSICEQFNSYLQSIKCSARNMRQDHFMFFLQFFAHIWNGQKRDATERRLQHAVQAAV